MCLMHGAHHGTIFDTGICILCCQSVMGLWFAQLPLPHAAIVSQNRSGDSGMHPACQGAFAFSSPACQGNTGTAFHQLQTGGK